MTRIIAVTVTYGDRFETLCRETLERAMAAGVSKIIVVDNGSLPSSAAALQKYASDRGKLEVLRNEKNCGSAIAFAAALEVACRDADFIWMLDDDNWVEPATLETLLAAQMEEAAVSGDDDIVVCARRIPNALHDRVLQGTPPGRVYPPPGAFLGFDALTYAIQRWRGNYATAIAVERVRIPYAPYGGLLLRPAVVAEVGTPDSRFVLYADDTVWTAKVVAAGYPIVLVASAVIADAEGKWMMRATENSVRASIRSPHVDRLFLSTRNRAWFDRSRLSGVGTRVRYTLNRLIVMAVALSAATTARSRRGFCVFRQAIRDADLGDFTRGTGLGR